MRSATTWAWRTIDLVEKDAKPGPDQFNFGFVAMERGTRSLMSYNDQCVQQKKNCMRLLQVSSPNIKVGGDPIRQPDQPPAGRLQRRGALPQCA